MAKKVLTEAELKKILQKNKFLVEYTFIQSDDLQEDDDDEVSTPEEGGEMPIPSTEPETGGVEGFNPQADEENIEMDLDVTPTTQEVATELVDIDQLTAAQKEGNEKIDSMRGDFDSLLNVVKQLTDFVQMQSTAREQDNEALKQELEKRLPTQVEKLSLRSLESAPFSETPEEFWDEKQEETNYSIEDDKNGVNQPQYTITKSDVQNDTDWRSISKSMDNPSNRPQNLATIFNY